MDIPTPETVLMEALFEDKQAEAAINELQVLQMIRRYAGKPMRMQLENLPTLKGKYTRPCDVTVDLANRLLHQSGWHIKVVTSKDRVVVIDGHKYWGSDLVIDKIGTNFYSRLIRAVNVLLGKE